MFDIKILAPIYFLLLDMDEWSVKPGNSKLFPLGRPYKKISSKNKISKVHLKIALNICISILHT